MRGEPEVAAMECLDRRRGTPVRLFLDGGKKNGRGRSPGVNAYCDRKKEKNRPSTRDRHDAKAVLLFDAHLLDAVAGVFPVLPCGSSFTTNAPRFWLLNTRISVEREAGSNRANGLTRMRKGRQAGHVTNYVSTVKRL